MGALEEGATYTRIAAGDKHTVLLRSDGTAVACGYNIYGQCNVPAPKDDVYFVPISSSRPDFVVQLFIEAAEATIEAVCRYLSGEQIASWIVPDKASCVKRDIDKMLVPGVRKLGVVLPDGRLLTPKLTWDDLLSEV